MSAEISVHFSYLSVAAGVLRFPHGGGANSVFSSFVCSLHVRCRGVIKGDKKRTCERKIGE